MELPGLGTVGGSWDLRPTIDAYLGHVDVHGKRVLDLGTASGYLTFELERRGAAEVVSFDIDSVERLDMVPFAGAGRAADLAYMASMYEGVVNAYWLAHRLLGSRARVVYGSAYDLPDALEPFDVAIIGMMLPHVERPVRVLEQVARLAETVVVVQQAPGHPDEYAYLMPDPLTPPAYPYPYWWSMSDACVRRMLRIVGYETISQDSAFHACPERGPDATEACTTTVAVRRG